MALAKGQCLAHYEIVAPLGAGAMGEVYRALDTRLGREVAIKVLPAELAGQDLSLRRFEREARALAVLNHPGIATLHGVDQDQGLYFLILELVPGTSLAERMEAGRVSLQDSLAWAEQVAAALDSAHRAGVVHRDLKPQNVMITPDGVLKLLDFGLAKQLEVQGTLADSHSSSITAEGTLLGTIDYMSPEQSRGREVDARTDIWSFGCVLFELLCGQRIFPADSVPDKLAAIASDEPDWSLLPAATPWQIRELLRACLQKDREERRGHLRGVDWRPGPVRSPGEAAPGVAVLPFVNRSERAEDEYFSDGVTEEIILALSRVPGLRVAARSSSFSFKGRNPELSEVGDKLGVPYVLEGSVRRSGSRVRIAVQLVQVEGAYPAWSERFDGSFDDLFDVQDEVAAAVVKALSAELLPQDGQRLVPRRTRDLAAYDLHLQGRFLLEQRGASLVEATSLFERAIDVDPELAAAQAGLAEARGLLAYYGSCRPREWMPKARDAAARALELDPHDAEAHTAQAWLSMMYDWDDDAAEASFQRALALDPRAVQARLWYGAYILTLFRHQPDEGIALCAQAAEFDPLSTSARIQLAVAQNFARRPEAALETLEPLVGRFPASYLMHFHRGLAFFLSEDYAAARETLQQSLALSSLTAWSKGLLGASLVKLGDLDEALELQDQLEGSTGYLSPACLALTPMAQGDHERVLELLQAGLQERDGLVRVLPSWSVFDPLWAEPRFQAILAQVGLASR